MHPRDLARHLLQDPLPRRWAHTQGVAGRAQELSHSLERTEAYYLVAAAWLHDIGYAPSLVASGLHPLDGARYLRDVQRTEPYLCRLVAHHSCAVIEAEERGLLEALLAEFAPVESGALVDALIYCDMTTGPDGQQVTVEHRLAEIKARYGEDNVVGRSIGRATSDIAAAVQRIESWRTKNC